MRTAHADSRNRGFKYKSVEKVTDVLQIRPHAKYALQQHSAETHLDQFVDEGGAQTLVLADGNTDTRRTPEPNGPARTLVFALVWVLALAIPQSGAAQAIEVKDAWLKRNCLDRGTSDHPLVGKEFEACLRKQIEGLPALDKNRREFFGERYDPPKYVECRLQPANRNSSACNVFILRRREWPEYWPENAVRPKWPEAPKESAYRKGMKPREYWEALCKAEAGEFIYKTVKDVEGFLLVRPRGAETDYAMQDKYVIEDAYGLLEFGYADREKRPGVHFLSKSGTSYRYVESGVATGTGSRVRVRHEVDFTKLSELRRLKPSGVWGEKQFTILIDVETFDSRFGLAWRGISRENDFEMGISGGELAAFDLTSGELVALRRGFALDPYAARGSKDRRWWLSSLGCPVMARESLTLTAFVRKALPPKGY